MIQKLVELLSGPNGTLSSRRLQACCATCVTLGCCAWETYHRGVTTNVAALLGALSMGTYWSVVANKKDPS